MQPDEEITLVARAFSALGNPVRLRILQLLAGSDRPLHIKAVAKLTKTRYNSVYKHVKILEDAGLITIFEVGRSRVLSLKNPELISRVWEFGKNFTKK